MTGRRAAAGWRTWARVPRPPGRAGSGPVDAVEPLVAAFRAAHPASDPAELRRAYEVAERMHRGQMRKSGNPYITHPLAVATILAGLGMDRTCLVAALLHDTVEDTAYTLGEVRVDFGDEVAVIVDGVTKLDGARWGKETAEAETFRKIVLAAAADLRVLIIKLADRLHNLRTLGAQPPHKRERIARATLDLLIPFADRLGLHVLKREMDDLAFATLDPDAFTETQAKVAEVLPRVEAELGPAAEMMRAALAEHGVRAKVELRPRHLYSVHRTLPGDLDGLRTSEVIRFLVLVDGSEQDCYVALGAVHAALHPITGRVKDYIAIPRFNLYRALHTVLIGPEGDMLDVMIRTRQMHEVAEYGVIAHIRQGDKGEAPVGEFAGRRDLAWLARLLAWQSDAPSATFLDGLRTDLAEGNMPVFTPEGMIVPLPPRSTALDYAYALDPETGEHSIGALINGRLAPLSAEVRLGNVVEVLTAPDACPGPDWLSFARTAQARVHIQRFLDAQATDEAALTGREALRKALATQGIDLLTAETAGDSLAIARSLGHSTPESLYLAIASGTLPLPTALPHFTTRHLPS
ncbi:HD domain-containing protein [Actinocorallia sp. API 0066]|uniref:RelA/SpoT family protein n=1 Tax=Actinocorallia sp. API 0066 TaxID=2896846 RepID=UPI001E2F1412|nr:HD domain-containing protein [Actinocorallia sp. API 0066]MCD0451925.1 HD domain-containing protein [Actinocorallia sp. API 0066]